MLELKSQIDDSVNFITKSPDGGYYESRYVRREDHYFICYLSSHSGCNKGCSFCHLTSTKQTMMKDARHSNITKQAEVVFEYYKTQKPAEIVNFNFMARGEPLDSPCMDSILFQDLYDIAFYYKVMARFNISTIMPKTLINCINQAFWHTDLARQLGPIYPTIYYSLYSTDKEFRSKWLPGAMDHTKALELLKQYQELSGKIVYIHGAFIEGENDSYWDVDSLLESIEHFKLLTKFNIVRYNPPDNKSKESPRLEEIKQQIEGFGIPCQIVTRVGLDVFSSCGMFYNGEV